MTVSKALEVGVNAWPGQCVLWQQVLGRRQRQGCGDNAATCGTTSESSPVTSIDADQLLLNSLALPCMNMQAVSPGYASGKLHSSPHV